MFALQNTVGKLETHFHIRLKKHRKGIKHPNAIEACKHFNNWSHVFHKHGKFILTEQFNNIKNTSTEVLKQRKREYFLKKTKNFNNFWIKLITKISTWHAILPPPFILSAYGSNI